MVDDGVTLDDLGGGEDKGEGEEDVLHTVEDDEEAVLSPDSPPLCPVVILLVIRPPSQ